MIKIIKLHFRNLDNYLSSNNVFHKNYKKTRNYQKESYGCQRKSTASDANGYPTKY